MRIMVSSSPLTIVINTLNTWNILDYVENEYVEAYGHKGLTFRGKKGDKTVQEYGEDYVVNGDYKLQTNTSVPDAAAVHHGAFNQTEHGHAKEKKGTSGKVKKQRMTNKNKHENLITRI